MRLLIAMVVWSAVAIAAPAREWPVAGRCLRTTTTPRTCVQVSRADADAIRATIIAFADGPGKARLDRATHGHPRFAARFRTLAKRSNTETSIGGLTINGFRTEIVQVGLAEEDGDWDLTVIVFVARDGAAWKVVDVSGSATFTPRDEPLAPS